MKKYLVTFYIRVDPFAMIEVYAKDSAWLYTFIDRFYPDVNWDYKEIK